MVAVAVSRSLASLETLGGGRFSPAVLFAASEPGVWYDPSDVANTDWRYNLLTFTEQFDNAAWEKSGTATIASNTSISPDGTMTADTFRCGSTAASEVRRTTFSIAAGSHTFSVYAKKEVSSFVVLQVQDTTTVSAQRVWFNLNTGQVGTFFGAGTNITLLGSAINAVGDGFYRCSISVALTSLTAAGRVSVFVSEDNGSFTGTALSGIYIWGAQLEAGSTASTYQPITTVAAETIARFPYATLYQDSAGTTPVTAPAQPVGLMLSKDQGLVIGPELVTNGDFSDGTTGWTVSGADATHIVTFSGGTMRYQSGTTSPVLTVSQSLAMTVGKTYLVEVTTSAFTSGALKSDNFGSTIIISDGLGTKSFRVVASSASFSIQRSTTNVDITIDNISVKELPGNHATQSTSASRPTYAIVPATGRRNLLTYSEQFDNASWSKTRSSVLPNIVVSPSASLTGSKLVEDTSTGTHEFAKGISGLSAVVHTYSIYAKAAERTVLQLTFSGNGGSGFANYDLASGILGTVGNSAAATITSVGNGWYRCTLTSGSAFTAGACTFISGSQLVASAGRNTAYTGDGTSGLYLWGAQAETGATATAYQKVVTAFEVTEANVASLSYLSFDGVDDFMVTPTITPGTDKVQVFAGVRKLSDAAQGQIAEFSPSAAANDGAFDLIAAATASTYSFRSRGTVAAIATSAASFAAPVTNVITGLGDIVADTTTLRVDGTQVAQSGTDQGTGNYLAYPMYIGRRGGTSLPFNGNLFGLVTRFGANLDTGRISQTENWLGQKTGVAVS